MERIDSANNLIARFRGLALCCIPKNANSSMKLAILCAQGFQDIAKDQLHRHSALNLGGSVDGLYTAAFLRHPAARLVSTWQNKLLRNAGRSTQNLELHGFCQGMSFAEFVQLAVVRSQLDLHIRPQVDFLPNRLDFVGRIETLDSDWARLQRRFSWLPSLGKENCSVNGRWQQYCDAETLHLIETHYANDMALCNQHPPTIEPSNEIPKNV